MSVADISIICVGTPPIGGSGGSGGGGQVNTVVGTLHHIVVNSTDPANPIVDIGDQVTTSAALASAISTAAANYQPVNANLTTLAGGSVPSFLSTAYNSAISTALSSYSTTTAMNSAISSAISTAAASYQPVNSNLTALAGGSVPGSVTGTTQSPGDNTTKLATTAFVETAVSGAGISTSPGISLGDALKLPNFRSGVGSILAQINTVIPKILCIGDSITASGGGTSFANKIALRLKAAGVEAYDYGIRFCGGADMGPSDFTRGTGWSNVGGYGPQGLAGNKAIAGTTTGDLTFADSEQPTNTNYLIYYTCTSTGASADVQNPSGFHRVTLTPTSGTISSILVSGDTTPLVIKAPTGSGDLIIIGILPYGGAGNAAGNNFFSVTNAGASGTSVSTWPTGITSLMNMVAPKLTIIDLMTNSLTAGTSAATWKAAMQTMITAVLASGSDCVLVVTNPVDDATFPGVAALGAQYQTAAQQLVASNSRCTLVDLTGRWIDYPTAVSYGFSGADPLHPTSLGHQDITAAIFEPLGQVIGIRGGTSNPITTLGDLLYGSTAGALARLAGNATTTPKYLKQTGTGSVSAAPVWSQPTFSELSGSASAAQLPTFTGDVTNNSSGVTAIKTDVALAGNPTTTTQTAGNSTTRIATTAFVTTSFAPLASPALTGNPTAPTQSPGDNTTKIATTAFVTAAVTAGGGGGGSVLPSTNAFRMSLTSGNSHDINNVTGATIGYLTPHSGSHISTRDAGTWTDHTSVEISLAISSDSYRLFNRYARWNGSAMVMEDDAWDSSGRVTGTITGATAAEPCVLTATNTLSVGDFIVIDGIVGSMGTDTVKGLNSSVGLTMCRVSARTSSTITLEGMDTTSLTYTSGGTFYRIPTVADVPAVQQDGVLCKTGALDRRLVGVYMSLTGGTTENSTKNELFCNVDNLLSRPMNCADLSPTWDVAHNGYRPTNANTKPGVGRINIVKALPQQTTFRNAQAGIGIAGTYTYMDDIGLNSNVTPQLCVLSNSIGGANGYSNGQNFSDLKEYLSIIPAGFSYVQRLENTLFLASVRAYGLNTTYGTILNNGMVGSITH